MRDEVKEEEAQEGGDYGEGCDMEDTISDTEEEDEKEDPKDESIEHENDNRSKIPCPQCDFEFEANSRTELIIHQLEVHDEKKTKYDLENNMKTEIFPCQHCSSTFSVAGSLHKHIALKHKNENEKLAKTDNDSEWFSCVFCHDSFPYASSLHKHISAAHKNEKEADENVEVNCSVCNEIQPNKKSLHGHMDRHHPEVVEERRLQVDIEREARKLVTYDCEKCGLKCKTMNALRKHKRGVHGEMGGHRVTCDDCGMSLYDMKTLLKHRGSANCLKGTRKGQRKELTAEEEADRMENMKTEGRGKFRVHCSFCVETFPSHNVYIIHRALHINQSGEKWKCLETKCGKTFRQAIQLRTHMKRHRQEFNYTCSECGNKFVSRHGYETHMQMHRGEFNFSCEECGKEFITKNLYQQHKKIHAPPSFSCDQCGKMYVDQPRLKRHIQKNHGPQAERGYEELICHICSRVIRSKWAKEMLTKHIRNVHQGLGKQYKCKLCDNTYKGADKLKEHVQSVHEGIRHFCDQCEASFSAKQALSSHIKYFHGMEKRKLFPCQECKIHYAKQHFSCGSHFNIKSVYCDKCGYMTKNVEQLRSHQSSNRCDPNKVINKSFKCTKCTRGFTTEKALHKHEQEHVTGKPHKCHLCGMGFTEKWNIRKHLASKTGCKGLVNGAQGQPDYVISEYAIS